MHNVSSHGLLNKIGMKYNAIGFHVGEPWDPPPSKSCKEFGSAANLTAHRIASWRLLCAALIRS